MGKEVVIGVSTIATNTHEIGFKIFDADGALVCERIDGYSYDSSMVFCRFCPGCTSSYPNIAYTYTLGAALVDGGKNGGGGGKNGGGGGGGGKGKKRLLAKPVKPESTVGYNGTVLAFKQQDTFIEFGSDYTSGANYGPVDVAFTAGMTVQVVAVTVPADVNTTLLSYQIQEKVNGTTALRMSAGTTFSQGDVLGSFIPNAAVASALKSSHYTGDEEEFGEQEVIPAADKDKYVVAVIVLSILATVFMISTIFLLIKRRNVKGTKGEVVSEQTVGSATNI